MANTTHIYRDRALQEMPEDVERRQLSINRYDVLDEAICSLGPLGDFMRLLAEQCGDELSTVGEVGIALVESAERRIEKQIALMREHFGSVSTVHYSKGDENRAAGVAGDFIGVEVMRMAPK